MKTGFFIFLCSLWIASHSFASALPDGEPIDQVPQGIRQGAQILQFYAPYAVTAAYVGLSATQAVLLGLATVANTFLNDTPEWKRPKAPPGFAGSTDEEAYETFLRTNRIPIQSRNSDPQVLRASLQNNPFEISRDSGRSNPKNSKEEKAQRLRDDVEFMQFEHTYPGLDRVQGRVIQVDPNSGKLTVVFGTNGLKFKMDFVPRGDPKEIKVGARKWLTLDLLFGVRRTQTPIVLGVPRWYQTGIRLRPNSHGDLEFIETFMRIRNAQIFR